MAKRRSESARVIQYFATAPLDAAVAILGIANETVKARGGTTPPKATKRTKVTKATRTTVNGVDMVVTQEVPGASVGD